VRVQLKSAVRRLVAEEARQGKAVAGSHQQQKDAENDVMMTLADQRQPGEGGAAVAPDIEATIQQARGGGQGIPNTICTPLEQALRADFSGVRVHTDAQSDQLNRWLQSKAFTTGQDVFFRHGAYDPGSRGGRETLAHELTHVVQQTGTAALPRVSRHPARVIQRLEFKEDKKRNLPTGSSEAVEKFGEMDIIVQEAAKVQNRLAGDAQKIYTEAKMFVEQYRNELVPPSQAQKVIKQVTTHHQKCIENLRPALQQLQEGATQAAAEAKAKAEAMQQARENAARAPALLEDVETATLSAAKAMDQAMSAAGLDEVAKAAVNAKAAADTAKQTAEKLNHISAKVKEYELTDLYEAVESHQKAADNAVRAAEQCAAQADRLAILSKARQAAAQRQQDLQDVQAGLEAAKQRVQIAAEQLAQLEGVQTSLETRAAESKGEAFADA